MSIAPGAPSPHFAVRPDWLARHDEPVLEPNVAIVDAHHHLWDRPENRYLFFDFLDDVNSGHDIRATVFMECGAMYRSEGRAELRPLGETEFATGVAALSASGAYGDTRVCAAIAGFGDLLLGDRIAPVLERHRVIAGERFCGIRHIAAWHADPAARGSMATPPPGLLGEAQARRGLRELTRLGLNFETFVYHTQLGELTALARDCPDLIIVANHLGGPIGIGPYAAKRDEVFRHWREGIRDLARCPNVRIKLTGLGMRVMGFGFGAGERPPSSAELAAAWAPYVETAVEVFGVSRALFGSNFPVEKGSCSYRVLWNAFKRIVAGASRDEKTALFSGTASDLYRLTAVPAPNPMDA
ncbi:amidohydrolase family protein [Chelatococcus sp. GCM10030263]|uniref:amidohydrolase family protein n=1 Tax=Chelatococcus sp. GCM10030263 TaxID=3273387 RepID=UPI0036183D06